MPINSRPLPFNRKLARRAQQEKGITIVEVMISVLLLGTVVVLAAPMIQKFLSGHSSSNVRQSVTICSQEISTRLQHALLVNRRILSFGLPITQSYLTHLDLSHSGTPVAWGRVVTVNPTGVLSPNLPGYMAENTGNSIFFVQQSTYVDVGVYDRNGNMVRFRIDVFNARYFYLSEEASTSVLGQPRLELWDWKSIPYLNQRQLLAITDPVARGNLVRALVARGYSYAWDPTEDTFAVTFSQLVGGNVIFDPNPTVLCAEAIPLVKDSLKLSQGEFRCGISPNTPTPNPLPVTVPIYLPAAGQMPGGFELLVVGLPRGRQVLARMVFAAEGPYQSPWAREQTTFVTVNDQW